MNFFVLIFLGILILVLIVVLTSSQTQFFTQAYPSYPAVPLNSQSLMTRFTGGSQYDYGNPIYLDNYIISDRDNRKYSVSSFTTGKSVNTYPDHPPVLLSPQQSIIDDSLILPFNLALEREETRELRENREIRDTREKDRFIFRENGRNIKSIGEKCCLKAVETFLQQEVEVNASPAGLVNRRGSQLYLDVYFPGFKNGEKAFVVEYNGKQHYEFTPIFHRKEEDFVRQQENDEDKAKWCLSKGIKLFIVPWTVDSGKKNKNGNWYYVKCSESERYEKIDNFLTGQLLEYLTGSEICF